MTKPRKHYDVTISIYDADRTFSLHFYRVSIPMLYALREKYRNLYGDRVEAIEVVNAANKKRVAPLCYHADENIDEQSDLWEKDGW